MSNLHLSKIEGSSGQSCFLISSLWRREALTRALSSFEYLDHAPWYFLSPSKCLELLVNDKRFKNSDCYARSVSGQAIRDTLAWACSGGAFAQPLP